MVPKDAPKNSASYACLKKSNRSLRPPSENTYVVTIYNMSRCNISVKTKFKKISPAPPPPPPPKIAKHFRSYLHQVTILREETFSEILLKFRDVTSSNLGYFFVGFLVNLGMEMTYLIIPSRNISKDID